MVQLQLRRRDACSRQAQKRRRQGRKRVNVLHVVGDSEVKVDADGAAHFGREGLAVQQPLRELVVGRRLQCAQPQSSSKGCQFIYIVKIERIFFARTFSLVVERLSTSPYTSFEQSSL